MDGQGSELYEAIRAAGEAARRQKPSLGIDPEREFIRMVMAFRSEMLADGLSQGCQAKFVGQATKPLPTLVIVPGAAVASMRTGEGTRRHRWSLVVGSEIPPTIANWEFDIPIPVNEYEAAQKSSEAIHGLAPLLANRRAQGLPPEGLVSNLDRALAMWRHRQRL